MLKVLIDAKDLRVWRAGHNITLAETASLLGVSRQSVSNWENGRVNTPRNLAERLAKADVALAGHDNATASAPKLNKRDLAREIKAHRVKATEARIALREEQRRQFFAGLIETMPPQETIDEHNERVNRELIDLFGTTGE